MTPAAEQITHPSEDQLGFFGLTPDGSLVLNIPEEATEPGTRVVVPVGYPDFRFPAESVHIARDPFTPRVTVGSGLGGTFAGNPLA